MTLEFITLSGILNIATGVLLLIYWFAFALFMPYKELSTTLALLVEHRNWVWINSIGVLGALFGLLGQAGILAIQNQQVSWVGSQVILSLQPVRCCSLERCCGKRSYGQFS